MPTFVTSEDHTIRLKTATAPATPAVVEMASATLELRIPRQRAASRHPAVTAAQELRWLEFAVEASRPDWRTQLGVRIFDLIVASVALIVLSPLMLVVAIAVLIDSPGPILYGSSRVGYAKPRFTAWKFRSMRPDADRHLRHLLHSDPAARKEYAAYHKLREDPRLTAVGRFIRKTSMDELPQLFNILKGEMSVVGPRPKLARDAEIFGAALPVVLQVKPGLTGLWQVSGRNRLPVNEWVTLDLEYARNRTFIGDLKICVQTFIQLWRPGRHGAY